MEEGMKECRNKRCSRRGVLLYAPNRKYCSTCGAKMKNVWDRTESSDAPHIVELEPDEPPRSRQKLLPINGHRREGIVTTVSIETGKPEKLPWQKFRGTYQDYQAYEKEYDSGVFHRFTPGGEEAGGGDTFTCADPDVEGCPLVPRKQTLIHLPWEMYQKWIHLCRAFDTEWIAYLKGTHDEATGIWTLTEMYFPKQRANSGHVDAEDGEILPDTIGSVHSHVGMSAFFSAEDKKHFNHPVEMVVNRSGDLAIAVRMKLGCGKMSRVDSNALLIGVPTYDADKEALSSKLTDTSKVGYVSTGRA